MKTFGRILNPPGSLLFFLLVVGTALPVWSQTTSPGTVTPVKPTFVTKESVLRRPITIIAYGDMRFTDPATLPPENVTARRALVARIAQEKPDAVLLSGDLTMHGGDLGDYAIYHAETQAWRDANLRIFPVMGNHEVANCELQQCLRNWWEAFPELRGHRWYSTQLGTRIYVVGLDSNESLLPGSPQHHWLEQQLLSLPESARFVLFTMDHEPVGDVQLGADDNPRPNEMAVAQLLKSANRRSNARFVVIAGHIHNYERFERNGVVYLVSGGGGAPQQTIDRQPDDLFRANSYPNFHYVKFTLSGDALEATMYRLANMNPAEWESKDNFKVMAKTGKSQ